MPPSQPSHCHIPTITITATLPRSYPVGQITTKPIISDRCQLSHPYSPYKTVILSTHKSQIRNQNLTKTLALSSTSTHQIVAFYLFIYSERNLIALKSNKFLALKVWNGKNHLKHELKILVHETEHSSQFSFEDFTKKQPVPFTFSNSIQKRINSREDQIDHSKIAKPTGGYRRSWNNNAKLRACGVTISKLCWISGRRSKSRSQPGSWWWRRCSGGEFAKFKRV